MKLGLDGDDLMIRVKVGLVYVSLSNKTKGILVNYTKLTERTKLTQMERQFVKLDKLKDNHNEKSKKTKLMN